MFDAVIIVFAFIISDYLPFLIARLTLSSPSSCEGSAFYFILRVNQHVDLTVLILLIFAGVFTAVTCTITVPLHQP